MTQFFGTGRFCSDFCAHARQQSEQSRIKVSETLKKSKDSLLLKNKEKYYSNQKTCIVCGLPIEYEKRRNKTCSKECYNKFLIDNGKYVAEKSIGKNKYRRNFKWGTYNGFICDSSRELAFVIYKLENGFNISQCKEFFPYTYKDKQHLYLPDFIVDGVYYEIKGYFREVDIEKKNQFPKDKELKILFEKDIKLYLKYTKEKYGEEFYRLYDRNFPSWMDYE